MGRFRVGTGSIQAEVDVDTEALLRDVVDRSAPGVREALERAASDVYESARARWPVRTGRSRDGLEWVIVVAPDLSSIRASVINDVEYARYIKARNLQGKSAFVELLQKPIRARTDKLVSEIGPVIGRG